MRDKSASRSATAGVSSGIAGADALNAASGSSPAASPSAEEGLRFPGEDAGRSLAEVAQRDLDAALQLLAERAKYITGATGAAIALRRGQLHDMLCRASDGANAPELGALLSTEQGLSGESVRTRKPLRCDNAETDARVNRESCRELGIASVVIMPILSGEQVLGVFELFSEKPNAFDERDLSALERLGEMVETAVAHAVAAQLLPGLRPVTPESSVVNAEASQREARPAASRAEAAPSTPSSSVGSALVSPVAAEPAAFPPAAVGPKDSAGKDETGKKPLFWTAPVRAESASHPAAGDPKPVTVPPGLSSLQKCQACGFPVSRGRVLCVECEQKQSRGEQLPQPPLATNAAEERDRQKPVPEAEIPLATANVRAGAVAATVPSVALQNQPAVSLRHEASAPIPNALATAGSPHLAVSLPDEAVVTKEAEVEQKTAAKPERSESSVPASDSGPSSDNRPTLFEAPAEPSRSWLVANKYLLGAMLVVVIVVAAIVWLR